MADMGGMADIGFYYHISEVGTGLPSWGFPDDLPLMNMTPEDQLKEIPPQQLFAVPYEPRADESPQMYFEKIWCSVQVTVGIASDENGYSIGAATGFQDSNIVTRAASTYADEWGQRDDKTYYNPNTDYYTVCTHVRPSGGANFSGTHVEQPDGVFFRVHPEPDQEFRRHANFFYHTVFHTFTINDIVKLNAFQDETHSNMPIKVEVRNEQQWKVLHRTDIQAFAKRFAAEWMHLIIGRADETRSINEAALANPAMSRIQAEHLVWKNIRMPSVPSPVAIIDTHDIYGHDQLWYFKSRGRRPPARIVFSNLILERRPGQWTWKKDVRVLPLTIASAILAPHDLYYMVAWSDKHGSWTATGTATDTPEGMYFDLCASKETGRTHKEGTIHASTFEELQPEHDPVATAALLLLKNWTLQHDGEKLAKAWKCPDNWDAPAHEVYITPLTPEEFQNVELDRILHRPARVNGMVDQPLLNLEKEAKKAEDSEDSEYSKITKWLTQLRVLIEKEEPKALLSDMEQEWTEFIKQPQRTDLTKNQSEEIMQELMKPWPRWHYDQDSREFNGRLASFRATIREEVLKLNARYEAYYRDFLERKKTNPEINVRMAVYANIDGNSGDFELFMYEKARLLQDWVLAPDNSIDETRISVIMGVLEEYENETYGSYPYRSLLTRLTGEGPHFLPPARGLQEEDIFIPRARDVLDLGYDSVSHFKHLLYLYCNCEFVKAQTFLQKSAELTPPYSNFYDQDTESAAKTFIQQLVFPEDNLMTRLAEMDSKFFTNIQSPKLALPARASNAKKMRTEKKPRGIITVPTLVNRDPIKKAEREPLYPQTTSADE